MLSLKGLYILLKLPYRILFQIIRHIFVGGPYRKYRNNLINSLKITVFRACVSLPLLDAKIISFISTGAVLNKVIPFSFKKITKDLNKYGKRYDRNSYWLVEKPNRTKEDPVLIFIHGGGYFIELAPLQVESVIAIYKLLDAPHRQNLSILILDYKLVCHGYTMPYQINQLDSTYKRLSETTSNIILMGDSAGGNMCINYLQMLKLQPNPLYPSKAILISPWVKLVPDDTQLLAGLYFENTNIDIIDHKFFDMGELKYILGSEELKSLTVSANNKVPALNSDWDGISTLRNTNSDVLIICGEDESFRDDVLEWAETALEVPLASKYKYGDSNNKLIPEKHIYIRKRGPNNPHIRFYMEPWGIHDAVLYLENNILRKIRNDPKLTLDLVDRERYFGITRITEFLNDTL